MFDDSAIAYSLNIDRFASHFWKTISDRSKFIGIFGVASLRDDLGFFLKFKSV
jgi:hypothetical protein